MSRQALVCLCFLALSACTTVTTSSTGYPPTDTTSACGTGSCVDVGISDVTAPDTQVQDVAAGDIKLDSAPAETVSSGGVEMYSFAPSMTDPFITAFNEPHLAFYAAGSNIQHKLVVFLGGVGTKPSDYKEFCKDAALQGYHVLALSYPNDIALSDLCGDNLSCYDVVRQEYLDGVDHTDKIDISKYNSISNRITKALIWLDKYHTGKGWGDFFYGMSPNWSYIGLVGHSLGGGHAAMIAKLYKVRRVGLMAAVLDGGKAGSADWLSGSHATDVNAYVGFVHKQDPNYNLVLGSWTALGMGGSANLVDADATPPPYLNDQELTTAALVADPHGGVALDAATPHEADGTPKFRAVWQHLVGKVPSL